MADKTLTTLAAASAAALTDLVYMVIGGNSRQVTVSSMRSILGSRILSTITSTSYSLVEDDFVGGAFRDFNNASNVTVTIPSGLTAQQVFTGGQLGAGQVIIVAGAGVTLQSPDSLDRTRVQFSTFSLIPVGSDTYRLVGDIAGA